jgi:Ca-activated chloride channel homolog
MALPSLEASSWIHRLDLSHSTQTIPGTITGRFEITTTHPHGSGKLALNINGRLVGSRSTPPYQFSLDFGAAPTERVLNFSATDSKGRKKIQWAVTLNAGAKPLAISLQSDPARPNVVEARVSAPAHDPVVSVTFHAGGEQLAALTAAPWRLTLTRVPDSTIHAVARAQSGAEVSDFLMGGERIEVANYEVRRVPLFVSVTGRNGEPRLDLDSTSFRVLDNGTEATIVEFGRAFDQPLSIALVIDSSASMYHEMPNALKAARQFLSSVLEKDDRVAVFTLGESARRVQELTSNLDDASGSLENVASGGRTALYDGIESAIRELKNENRRRAIVVLSDGEDTSSVFTYDELFEKARRAAIPIFFVGFNVDEVDRSIDQGRALALETGGFLAIATKDDLQEKYRLIEEDLRAQYRIEYQIVDRVEPNAWRPVKVVLESPAMTARTIKGYFVP